MVHTLHGLGENPINVAIDPRIDAPILLHPAPQAFYDTIASSAAKILISERFLADGLEPSIEPAHRLFLGGIIEGSNQPRLDFIEGITHRPVLQRGFDCDHVFNVHPDPPSLPFKPDFRIASEMSNKNRMDRNRFPTALVTR